MKMKKGTIILIVVIGVVVLTLLSFQSTYNELVGMREQTKAQWSNVEGQYQRRADLIPNLVSTVKGYADHESATLTSVIEARSKATSVQVDFDKLSAEDIKKFSQAQSAVSTGLGRLLAVSEKYPDLKANQNFRDLQAQLEGTENRISVERRNFNESAKSYNSYVMQFPRNMIASMFGFTTTPYFESEAGSEKAPEVKF